MQGVAAAHAPKRDLHPRRRRPRPGNSTAAWRTSFRAAATGPRPNRYDEAIDHLRLAALRRDAAAAATSQTARANTPTDDDAVAERRRREGGE